MNGKKKIKMNKNTIEFKLNKKNKMIVELQAPLNDMHCCSDSSLFFIEQKKKIKIFDDSLKYGMELFNSMLQKSLNNELVLDGSIKPDIGYLYNEEIQDKPGLVYEQFEGRKFWVGRNYFLWGYGYLATWIYNNKQGETILEITPIYPGSFLTSRKKSGLISYEDWLANYKPYFLTVLSKDTITTLLEQTETIYKQINNNLIQKKIKSSHESL